MEPTCFVTHIVFHVQSTECGECRIILKRKKQPSPMTVSMRENIKIVHLRNLPFFLFKLIHINRFLSPCVCVSVGRGVRGRCVCVYSFHLWFIYYSSMTLILNVSLILTSIMFCNLVSAVQHVW